jgi:hypothetical protein
MAEPRDGLGLDPEPFAMLGVGVLAVEDHLQGDDPVQLAVPRLVDDPHAAATQLGQEIELREAGHVGNTERRAPSHLMRAVGIEWLLSGQKFRLAVPAVARSFGAFQRLLSAVTRRELRRERRRLASVLNERQRAGRVGAGGEFRHGPRGFAGSLGERQRTGRVGAAGELGRDRRRRVG